MRRVLAFEFLLCAVNVFVLVGVPFQGGLAAENILEQTLKLERQPQTHAHIPIRFLDLILSSLWPSAERIIQFSLFDHCEREVSTMIDRSNRVSKPQFEINWTGDVVR